MRVARARPAAWWTAEIVVGAARLIGLSLACAATIAACGGAAVSSVRTDVLPTTARLKVVVLTQTRGYHHKSIPAAVAELKRLAAHDGRYGLTFLPTAAVLRPALKGASAVVFLLTSGELPLGAKGKRALLAFVQDGGALVGFHSATDTFHQWPAFIRLIGAEFSHHPHPSTQRVIVEDHRNPATASLPASFLIDEEFYVFKHDPRPHVHVLARLDTGPHGPDRPLVWCRIVGRGRVFYDALGHFSQTWQDPRQIALVEGGMEWALGLSGGGRCGSRR